MNWTVVALVLMPTILLLVQAISCLKRLGVYSYIRGFGLLSILLWGLSVVLGIVWVSGTLVLSSEFGIVMVQGAWARFGLALVLVGSAVSVGMGLHVCRLQAERPKRWPWLLGAGLLIGVCAALRLKSLYPNDLPPLRIYDYDLWWPPLLVWLSLCLLDIILTAVNVLHRAGRLWCATVVVNGLALLALSQPWLADSHSEILWRSCLLVLVPISMSLVTWLFLPLSPRLGLFRYRLSRVLIWVPAGIGVWSGVFSLQEWHWQTVILLASWPAQMYQTGIGRTWPWKTVACMVSLLWLCWPGLIGLIAPPQLVRACRIFKPNWVMLLKLSGQQIGFLTASAFLALGLAVLSYFGGLDRTFLLNGGVLVWLLLVEAIAGGPLSRMLQRLIDRQQWSDTGVRALTIGSFIGSRLGAVLSAPSMPALIGKALVGMIILVVLNELPNAHKTLIQPFKVLGLPERTEFGKSAPERDEAGQAISEQVINTLGLLQQELRQEVILSLQPDSEDEEGRKKFELMSVGDSANVSAALSKSSELEIGGVKIPLGLLFAPLQSPIRRLLGVRIINASMQVDQHGYSLLARSDVGETWKLKVSLDEFSAPAIPISPEVITRLATELAFHIIKSDDMLAPAMTKSWAAFRPFKMGLKKWKQFETKQDYAALTSAIVHFRDAIQQDPGFAFAHYRLGLALQKDGQPGVAVKAFRASLKADPSLLAAYIALASTLYDFERTSYVGEVNLSQDFLAKLPPQAERIEKARDLWLTVLRLPGRGDSTANLGSAYYGLCRQAYSQGRSEARLKSPQERSYRSARNHGKTYTQARNLDAGGKGSGHPERSDIQDHERTLERWYYMAYYYCKRAEALYADLVTAQHTDPEVKKGEAYVLHTLGGILANFQRPNKPPRDDQPQWECWVRRPEGDLNSQEGLQYFMRALELLPDDYRLRCYAARTAYALGHPWLLERLEADAMVHLNLANSYRRFAGVCAAIARLSPAGYMRLEQTSYRRYVQLCTAEDGSFESAEHYRSALQEYDEAIRREPMNIDALIGYAYTVWELLVHAGHTKELRGWIRYYAEHALVRARKAVALSSSPPEGIMLALVRSRLGTAFLAQGSPEWAIQELEEAVLYVPNHPAYHEIRWALAQAYLCAASTGKSAGLRDEDVRPLEKRAIELLGDIRRQEGTREFQLYSDRPGVLNAPWGALICKPSDGMESMPDPPMTLPATWTSTAHLHR
jgi:tetratricopeptide (TPR) repeat protein